MVFPGRLAELMAEARENPAKLPAALMSCGILLSAASLSLMLFKAPVGVLLRLPGRAPGFVYYGTLAAILISGLAEASFGFCVVPRNPDGWRAAGTRLLWISIFPLVIVIALGAFA